jgi:hypothetical protein
VINEIFQLIEECYAADEFKLLDDTLLVLLSQLSHYEMPDIAIYLRATNMIRHRLKNWQLLLESAVLLSTIRGEDVEDIYLGLIN